MDSLAHPFWSVANVKYLRDATLKTGVPKVDPNVLTYKMLQVSRELKIHYQDQHIGTMNKEVIKRMIAWGHPDAKYNDEVNRLPDKSPMDVTFRDDSSGQPPQFEEKPVTLPPHLANQIQYKPFTE
jgi:hypothetical protein